MIHVTKAKHRGRTELGWLSSRHSFSFGEYYDPDRMGYSVLRVINDDVVAPASGFGTHPHRDMEIVTVVLEGVLTHRDSTGGGSVIRPGMVQRMSAGTGVRHSEWNDSETERCRLLQIWILPERPGLTPGYEEKTFPEKETAGVLRLVASRDGREGSVTIHQDAEIRLARLGRGDAVTFAPKPGRVEWLQVGTGRVEVGETSLEEGDGAAIEETGELEIRASEPSCILLFDLPAP